MALTLAELLKNPIFADATVVAGEKGLNRIIEWSHIIDVPDVVAMVGRGRCLIITTGQGIPLEPAAQEKFMTELAEANLAGMIISVGGKFFAEVPASLINIANHYDFPIVAVSPDIRFLEITRIIHEKVISLQYTLLKQSDHIHQTLSQIVLEGGGLPELAGTLVKLLHLSVTIEDSDLNLLAYADYGETDPARKASIEQGGTPTIFRTLLKERGVLDKLNNSLKPVKMAAWPEHGMTKERIVAPILVERKVYGYLWFIAGDNPLTEADVMTIERAAIVAALILLKDTAVRQTEARLQADVVLQILSEHPHTLALADKANRLGLDLNQVQRVLLLRPPEDAIPSLRLADKLRPIFNHYSKKAIIQPQGQNLIVIIPNTVDVSSLCQELLTALPGLKIGIGSSAPALINLAQSYQQAEEALSIGLTLSSGQDIFNFEDLGFLHWLYNMPPAAHQGNIYARRIDILATEEKAARAQLLRTLEVFLDQGANAAETARVLNIHRNTLAYRLKQIETYCNLSLALPENRLNLQIAVKAYRLQHNAQDNNR